MKQTFDRQFMAVALTSKGRYTSIPAPSKAVAEMDGHTLYRELRESKITVHSIYVEQVKFAAPIVHIAGLTHIF